MNQDSIDMLVNPFYFHINQNLNNQSGEVYCLIHGWTGNEKSMSIFSQTLPDIKLSVFPRGPVKLSENSYAWVDIRTEIEPTFNDYAIISSKLIQSVLELLDTFPSSNSNSKINLIGFSQGAAVCSVISILFPELINKVALLSGFLPAQPPNLVPETLLNKKYYIAHGTEDKLVDFNKSLELKKFLEGYGADINFCQEELGHKIGSKCSRNLRLFFETNAD